MIRRILALLSEQDDVLVIVDGGASIGDTSDRFASLFPKASVYAFEPFDHFIKPLSQKAVANHRIKVFPLALDEQTVKELFT